jgi:hypothetical protein
MRHLVRPESGVVLIVCLCAVPLARGQEARTSIPFDGSHVFRHFLKLHKLEPLQSLADLSKVHPQETLLVVFGDTRMLPQVVRRFAPTNGLSQFRQQGGAILIASDREGRLSDLNLSISGHGVHVVFWERKKGPPAYREKMDCPLLADAGELGPQIPAGLRQGIATNKPSSVSPDRDCPLRILAPFPKGCMELGGRRLQFGPLPYILGTNRDGEVEGKEKGPVLVLGGHGVFMNGMLAQQDNDNWDFAMSCLRWLTAAGQRKYALFIEEGRVVRTFDVPLIRVPLPIVPMINAGLRWIEEENLLNRLIQEHVDRDELMKWLLVGCSGLLGLYGLRRLVRAHHRGDPKVPLVAVRVAEDTSPQPAIARRRQAIVEEHNCWEAARDLARLCFEGHSAAGSSPQAPPLPVRKSRRWQRDVERLWRLAYGEPLPVSPGQFAVLVAMMARVRAALDDGALRFESSPQLAGA